MIVDDKLLQKLQKLSMLEIDKEKIEAIKKDLSDILGFVENISELELKDTDLQSSHELPTPLREDIKDNDPLIPESILKNAPNAKDGYFIVPKIIE